MPTGKRERQSRTGRRFESFWNLKSDLRVRGVVWRWNLIGVQSNSWPRCSPGHPHLQCTACAVLILGSRSTQTNSIQIEVDREPRCGHLPASCTIHFSTPHSIRSRKVGQGGESLHLFCYHPSFEAQVSPGGKKRETTGNIYFILPRSTLPQLFIFFFWTKWHNCFCLVWFGFKQWFQFFSAFSLLKQKLLGVTDLACFILTLKYIALKIILQE